jgi:Nucleotidyltransferase of unknown function (DUF6036)
MNRTQLEYAIREVGRRLKLDYFYIIGSAAVFASIPNASETAVTATRDVDVIPAPADTTEADAFADKIDFILGEGSDFDEEFGFYIQGVDHSTPSFAPKNWRERVIPIRSGGYTGLCMEIHDLTLSKYGAGREKDLEFTRTLVRSGHIQKQTLQERLKEVPADQDRLKLIRARIQADFR